MTEREASNDKDDHHSDIKQKNHEKGKRYVMKFGGSSLAGPKEILQCLSVIKAKLSSCSKSSLVVVCSALGDTTDHLVEAANSAKRADIEGARSILTSVKKAHEEAIVQVVRDLYFQGEARRFVEERFAELDKTIFGISLLNDVSARSLDHVLSFGERLSTFIVASMLSSVGIKAKYLTGGEAGIVTDECFGSADPIPRATDENLRKNLLLLLGDEVTPIVTGFIGETLHGHEITTLGRGGSDYTASLIGSAIDADEIVLWTDVDGILSADPRIVKDAQILKQITYLEAMEMSAFGAKSMQPRALEPAAKKEIPVRIKNTFRPEGEGTLIASPVHSGDSGTSASKLGGVKSIGSLTGVAIVSISGTSIVGQPGTAVRIFEILKDLQVSILMLSQSVSENNVSLVIRKDSLPKVIRAFRERLLQEEAELDEAGEDDVISLRSSKKKARIREENRNGKSSIFAKIEFEDDVSVIAVLGKGMIGTPGIAGRVFTTIANEGINIRMISQGSSEINISFVIKDKDKNKAVEVLHREFCLGATSAAMQEQKRLLVTR